MSGLRRGAVVWIDLDPTRGREQQGQRPALVICNDDYLSPVPAAVDRWLQDFLVAP